MRKILFLVAILMVVLGCKEQHDSLVENNEVADIGLLRADFKRQTGYTESNKHFLMEEFKSDIDWNKTVQKGDDTTFIKVNVLDNFQLGTSRQLTDVGNFVWIRAVKKSKKTIKYTLLIYAPEISDTKFSGLILKKEIGSGDLSVSFVSQSRKISKTAYFAKGDNSITSKQLKMQTKRASGSGCVVGYVNGSVNFVNCPPDQPDFGEDDGGGGGDDGPPDTWPSTDPIYDGGTTQSAEEQNTPTENVGEVEIDGCPSVLDEPDQKDPQEGDPKKVSKVDWQYKTKNGTVVTDWTDNTGRKHTHIKMDTYYSGFINSFVKGFIKTGTGVNTLFEMFKSGKLVSPLSWGTLYADEANYIIDEMKEYYDAKKERNKQNGTSCKPK